MSDRTAVGYVRVSTQEQVNGYSLGQQEAHIRAWCTDQGIELKALHRGTGESGKDLARQGWQTVEETIAEGGITHVVVAKVDRLSRSLRDTVALLQEWEEAGIHLVVLDMGITDPRGSNRMLIHLLAWIAEQERHKIRSRVRPGLMARAQTGLPPTRTPFGYRIAKSDDHDRVVVDERTGTIAQDIFLLAAQSQRGPQWLARRMNTQHAQTLQAISQERGSTIQLTRGLIQRMLTNPFYRGILAVDFLNDDGTPNPVVRLNNHPALVDEPTWMRVQDQRQQRASAMAAGYADFNATSLCGGIATCAHCGERMSFVAQAEQGGVYRCGSFSKPGPSCGNQDVPTTHIDMAVMQQLIMTLADLGSRMATTWLEGTTRAGASLDVQRERAHSIIDHNEQVTETALDDLSEGRMTADDFQALMTEQTVRYEKAQELLEHSDVWRWLGDLFGREKNGSWTTDAHKDGSLRLKLPLDTLLALMDLSGLRSVLRSATTMITCDGKSDQPVTTVWSHDPAHYHQVASMQGVAFAKGLLIDQRALLRRDGYQLKKRLKGGAESWAKKGLPNDVVLPPADVVIPGHR